MAALLLAAVSLACVRLGFWQLERWGRKRALNREQRAALAAPAVAFTRAALAGGLEEGRRVVLEGRFDARVQILLRGRSREGVNGVEVVTPFALAGDSLGVLVDRGWLAAEDGATLPAAVIPPDSATHVEGLVRSLSPGGAGPPPRVLEAGATTVLSAAALDRATLEKRWPVELAPIVVVALPESGGATRPLRSAPRPFDESVHRFYAAQWFAFALAIPALALAVRARRRRADAGSAGETVSRP